MTPQSGTLGIFSSREQEYEQKAQLLKRLAYVIFCSEIDQYAKYMPEIQGKKSFPWSHKTWNNENCRTTYVQFTTERAWDPSSSFLVFPGSVDSDEPASRDQSVAYHNQRNASSFPTNRAGIDHRHRRIQVSVCLPDCIVVVVLYYVLTWVICFFCS